MKHETDRLHAKVLPVGCVADWLQSRSYPNKNILVVPPKQHKPIAKRRKIEATSHSQVQSAQSPWKEALPAPGSFPVNQATAAKVASRAFRVGEFAVMKGGKVRRLKGNTVHPMEDCSSLLGSLDSEATAKTLATKFRQDGYLYFRKAMVAEIHEAPRQSVDFLVKKRVVKARDIDATSFETTIPAPRHKRESGISFQIDAKTGHVVYHDDDFDSDDDDEVDKMEKEWDSTPLGKTAKNIITAPLLTNIQEILSLELSKAEQVQFDPIPLHSYSWIRMFGPNQVSSAHSEYLYFKRETNLFHSLSDAQLASTCVSNKKPTRLCQECVKDVPAEGYTGYCKACQLRPVMISAHVSLSESSLESGTYCLMKGSHLFHDLDITRIGTERPSKFHAQSQNAKWVIAEMAPGDLLILDSRILQARSVNRTNTFVFSLDTRTILQPRRSTHTPFSVHYIHKKRFHNWEDSEQSEGDAEAEGAFD